ncbi:MAG: hypothetical protein HY815_24145 [Candidatus Riflebacteria bacterium]|nr:hypothetical protein [Candidatus Riflebacteria bacterium]
MQGKLPAGPFDSTENPIMFRSCLGPWVPLFGSAPVGYVRVNGWARAGDQHRRTRRPATRKPGQIVLPVTRPNVISHPSRGCFDATRHERVRVPWSRRPRHGMNEITLMI